MTHDPLCPTRRPFTAMIDDKPVTGYTLNHCCCALLTEARVDERSRKGTCWRETEGSQVPAGAIRVYREAGWFWETPTVNTIKTVDGVTEEIGRAHV